MKFLNKRREKETSEGKPSLQDDVTKRGKPAPDDAGSEEALVMQISNLEGLVNKRTRDLEEAKKQLKNLYSTPENTAGEEAEDKAEDKAEAFLVGPNKAERDVAERQTAEEQEREKEKEKEKEKEADNLLEKVGGGKAEEAKSEEAEEVEEANEEQSDDFFGEVEEEENPLAGLISSLPDVTIDELLHDAEEVKELATEWLRDEDEE